MTKPNFLDKLNKLLYRNTPLLIFGSLLTILILSLLYYLRPVVSMQGKLIDRTDDSVTIHVWGAKYRGSCKFLELTTYASKGGLLYATVHTRLDMMSDGTSKPAGNFDIGYWLIKSTKGAERVLMYVAHSCGEGDLRVTRIADVAL